MTEVRYTSLRQFNDRLVDSTQTLDSNDYAGNDILVDAASNITITLPLSNEAKLAKFNFVRTGSTVGSVTIDTGDSATITIRDVANGLIAGAASISSAAGAPSHGAVVELFSDGTNWFGTRVSSGWI